MNFRTAKYPKLCAERSRREKNDSSIDTTQDPEIVVRNILTGLCNRENTLKYLKAFVNFIKRIKYNIEIVRCLTKEVLICLKLSLADPSSNIRAGGLRAIRYTLKNENDVIDLNSLAIPYLISRCLDLSLKNDTERLEAMKLIRKILILSPLNFHNALAKSLISLANGAVEEKDGMIRICLATLCELCVLNSNQFIEIGGVAAVTRNLLECQMPKIAESLCGVLLYLLDKPCTRDIAAVDLLSVAAPYCDAHYKHGWKNRDERDLKFNCSRLAMLSILKSWPGILHFCNPDNKSGLKAIIDVLYLNQLQVRKAILDLFYELLGLPQPEWTDELSVALTAIDPSEPQVSWRLNEGFVVSEGQSVLPHLAKTTPKIVDMHLALLLYCFYNNGLVDALVEVIATSDTFISVRATVLLGELLRLIQIILPPECCNTSPALPTLLEYATKNTPQAIGAITALVQFHKLLKKKPTSHSLYLDYILKAGNNLKLSLKKNRLINHRRNKSIKAKLHQFVSNSGSDIIKETGVLVNKDHSQWNWNLIRIIVKGDVNIFSASSLHVPFLKRLVDFYLPSNNKYSHMDTSASKICLAYTMVGIDLIQFLTQLDDDEESESVRLLTDLFKDILGHINALTSGRSVHDCLLSPQHMVNTQCQNYFLFIGRLATTECGINILNQIDMFQSLQNLATTVNNDCYVKLIVSSMDYNENALCRNLLSSVLKCNIESSRLYATQFLLVLLRSNATNFASWGIPLLVNQLYDKSQIISSTALSILQESCEITECLQVTINTKIDFVSLGEKGTFLLAKMLSIPNGYAKFSKQQNLVHVIENWNEFFIYRYVRQIEQDISDSLTLHQRGIDGKYDKRSNSRHSKLYADRKDLHLRPHLYGQLSQHPEGFKTLTEHGAIDKFLKILACDSYESEDEILDLKASMWALAHLCTSHDGFELLTTTSENIVSRFIYLAQNSTMYSVRATAYYTLGLIGTTQFGADEIFKFGWVCTRHDRHESWPIIQEESFDQHHTESESESEDSFLVEYSFTGSPSSSSSSNFNRSSDAAKSLRIGSPKDGVFDRNGVWRKSSTLPINRNLSTVYHQRSMSESKTFEMIKNYETRLRERVGLSKHYNSNCSSMSSSGTYYSTTKLQGTHQPLSPIPSTSNVLALDKSQRKIRRHSESCKIVGSYERYHHKLSSQDLLGYTTLYYLRNSQNFIDENSSPSFNEMSTTEKNLSVEEFIFKSSLSSLSSVKKFKIYDKNKSRKTCYMGISLPQDLNLIFSDNQYIKINTCGSNGSGSSSSCGSSCINSNRDDYSKWSDQESFDEKMQIIDPNQEFLHNKFGCLECVQNNRIVTFADIPAATTTTTATTTQSLLKGEILQYIQLLSNPLWNKPSKLALFLLKQENPKLFQDPCLYSETCKILSENNYRLNIRRIIHELFFHINYVNMYEDANNLIKEKTISQSLDERKISDCELSVELERPKSTGLSTTNEEQHKVFMSNSASLKSIPDISGLKLSYKENKFPITRKDN